MKDIRSSTWILREAEATICDRGDSYGSPKENFERTAALFNIILKDKLKDQYTISAADVILLMLQVKSARLINSPDHKDSQIDVAGYASLLSEVA